MRISTALIIPLMFTASLAHPASSDFVTFTDAAAWQQAVGTYTTIGFNDFVQSTIVTEQYASLGVHFTDGTDVAFAGPTVFPNDGWGLSGHLFQLPDEIRLTFDTPQRWIAVHFPGSVRLELYRNGLLMTDQLAFVSGFGGVISSQAFDEVVIWDRSDGAVFIDDLHFGVPAPGALGLLALAGVSGPGRRRR